MAPKKYAYSHFSQLLCIVLFMLHCWLANGEAQQEADTSCNCCPLLSGRLPEQLSIRSYSPFAEHSHSILLKGTGLPNTATGCGVLDFQSTNEMDAYQPVSRCSRHAIFRGDCASPDSCVHLGDLCVHCDDSYNQLDFSTWVSAEGVVRIEVHDATKRLVQSYSQCNVTLPDVSFKRGILKKEKDTLGIWLTPFSIQAKLDE